MVCKDTVTLLGELTEDDIAALGTKGTEAEQPDNIRFKDIFDKFRRQ